MKGWKALAAMMCSLSASPSFAAQMDVSPYIVNGSSASVTTYTSFVSLFYDRIAYDGVYGVGSYCGGTMLDATHVLTAAHCIFDGSGKLDENYMLFTVVGQTDDESAFPNGNIETVRTAEFYYHPGYQDSSTNLWPNDIAIIKLASPLNVVGYTSIPSSESYRQGPDGIDDDTNTNVFAIVGHGNTSTGVDSTTELQAAAMLYVSNTTCQQDLSGLSSQQICFKGASTDASTGLDSGTCQGDSGGPIYWNNGGNLIQVGITSFGPTICGQRATYSGVNSVFTDVYDYSAWINSVLNGSVTPDYVASDAKRTEFLTPDSGSSGGSTGQWGIGLLMLIAAWRYRHLAATLR